MNSKFTFHKMANGNYMGFNVTQEMANVIRAHTVVSPLQWYYNPSSKRCTFALKNVDETGVALDWLTEDVLCPHETIQHQFDLSFLEQA